MQLEQDLQSKGISVNRIKSEQSFLSSIQPDDGVVMDGYLFDTDYHQKILELGCKLVLIDDEYKRPLCANLIINQAPGVFKENYEIQSDCVLSPLFALGPDYALLRPAFLEEMSSAFQNKTGKTLFICFGGSDVKNLTKRTLEIALDFKQFKKISIITGSAYEHHDELLNGLSKHEHVHFFHDLDDQTMASLLAEADIAVVPASGILFEAFSMQSIVISGMYVENQKNNYFGFKEMDAFVDAGTFEKEMLRNALEKASSFTPKMIIDRKSPGRYRALFKKIMN